MPPLPRRAVLAGLGLALATGAGRPFHALAAIGPTRDDITQPPDACPGLFGSRETAKDALLALIPKAEAVHRSLTDGGAMPIAAIGGDPGLTALAQWSALLAELHGADPMVQLAAVNRFVNAVAYVPDRRNYRMQDYWATPAEFFASGGDCEDYALTKFVSLHRLGFHEDRLRIAIAFDANRRLQHGFLAVYLAGDVYLLDNQIAAVTSHRRISHYRPICSFNSHRLWVHAR